MEKLYRDKIDEHYGVLGEHFIASENHGKGAEYLKLAARKTQKAASHKEAIEYAKKGFPAWKVSLRHPRTRRRPWVPGALGGILFQP
jgi:hypothetical protein